jgi:hypothetical protein
MNKKEKKRRILENIHQMAKNVVFLHDVGAEQTMYSYLLLIEQFKDLLEDL